MIRKVAIGILALMFLTAGCDFIGGKKTEETKTEEQKPAETKKSDEPQVGDTVVARWTGNSFYEGKVESLDGSKIKVKWNDGSSPSDVDKTDVYLMPDTDAKPEVAVGDMVLAKVNSGSYWNGAEVTKVEGGVYSVKTVENATTANVDGNKIIKISAATAANLKEKAGSTDFLKEAQAKKPEMPDDYKPKKGEKVLAEWTTNGWYTGKVEKIEGDKVTVAWDDGSTPSAVNMDKVMPYPTAANAKMPAAEQFVLIKPESGSKWSYGQTVSVKDKDIEVKDATGKTRTLKPGDFVVLN